MEIIGFLDGITAAVIITTGVVFGLLSFFSARKIGAKLLYFAGGLVVLVGLLWLGPFTEFLSVLITGINLPGELYGFLSYIWVAPAVVLAFYLGGELMAPEKTKIIVGIYTALGIVFEILMFALPNGNTNALGTFTWEQPAEGFLINTSFNMSSPTFWIILIFLISVLVFLGIGFALKAKQATGDLRRKFTYLSIGFIIFFVCGALDSVLDPGIAIGFVRLIMATFAIWTYLGLKT
jgi:hypothetical protein